MPDEPTFPTLNAIATCCGTRVEDVSRELLRSIQAAMHRYAITTKLRQAHFCAQIGHESDGLQYREEIWGPTPQQQRYEPPSDLADRLGNDHRGDGERYKGRGLIQLTGRANYEAYNKAVPVNVVDQPRLVGEPDLAADVAGWYWDRHGLNEVAGRDMAVADDYRKRVVVDITEEINGGHNGLDDRRRRLSIAKKRLFRGDPERVPAADVEPIVTTDPTDPAHTSDTPLA